MIGRCTQAHFLAAMLLGLLMSSSPRTTPRVHPNRGSIAACNTDAADSASFSADAWAEIYWDDDTTAFERLRLLSSLLDDCDAQQVNHAVWRGLGYTVGADGALYDPEGRTCPVPPDVMGDGEKLAKLEALMPLPEEDDLREEMEAALTVLVEALHGETLTRMKVKEGDADFNARRIVVQWLHLTALTFE